MKRFVSIKRLEAAAAAGALFLSLTSGCAAEAPQQSPDQSPPLSIPVSTELSLIAGSGGDWYAVEDGSLVAWGEMHGGEDYSQRVAVFEGAQSVWGYRFGQLVLDENGELWTTGDSGYDEPRTKDGWLYVLSDVVTASGNIWNGAAVRSDGSLWTWGKNDQGQLGNGALSEDGTNYPPQHIMDGVCLVRQGSYAVTTGGELYGIGLWSGCTEPKLLCEGVADAAASGAGKLQLLTLEGELYLASIPDRAGQLIQLPDAPAVSDVSEIFDRGYRNGAGTCFLWNSDATEALRVDLEAAQITRNLDGFLVLTEDGDYVRARVSGDQLTLTPLSEAEQSPDWALPVAQVPVSALADCFAIRDDGTLVELERDGSVTELLPNMAAVYVDQWATYAIDRQGTLWGRTGESGCLLPGAYHGTYVPDFVPLMEGVASVAQYSETFVMVKRDGTLWAWGDHLGEWSWREPVRIADEVLSAACEVFPGGLFVKQDHTLWEWQPVQRESGTSDISQRQLMEGVLDACHGPGGCFLVQKEDGVVWRYVTELDEGTGTPVLENVRGLKGRFLLQNDGTLWEMTESPDRADGYELRRLAENVSSVEWMSGWNCLLYTDQDGVLWTTESDGSPKEIAERIWVPT